MNTIRLQGLSTPGTVNHQKTETSLEAEFPISVPTVGTESSQHFFDIQHFILNKAADDKASYFM